MPRNARLPAGLRSAGSGWDSSDVHGRRPSSACGSPKGTSRGGERGVPNAPLGFLATLSPLYMKSPRTAKWLQVFVNLLQLRSRSSVWHGGHAAVMRRLSRGGEKESGLTTDRRADSCTSPRRRGSSIDFDIGGHPDGRDDLVVRFRGVRHRRRAVHELRRGGVVRRHGEGVKLGDVAEFLVGHLGKRPRVVRGGNRSAARAPRGVVVTDHGVGRLRRGVRGEPSDPFTRDCGAMTQ